ncbi:MAG TPA: hypothetical protein VNG89_05865 [Vicinamibacterales bacterium]|nr:hypothetical protein [Vicinamibacterales bacterium]
MRTLRIVFASLMFAAVTLVLGGTATTTSPRFYADDPIPRDGDSQDASRAARSDMGDLYEMVVNLFDHPGYHPSGLHAQNVNTIDEVPDSSWFTNRIGAKTLSIDEVVRGPNVGKPPDPSKWIVFRQKIAGVHPGVTARDASGDTWFLEFDPDYYPEAATGAVVMATKFFWALGYNQVESFLTTFDPRRVEFDPEATVRRPNGKRTLFTRSDLDELLEPVARRPDGAYRVIAGRLLPGKIIGNFRFEGTRPDDPNDLVPHELRRELRALRVFGAWTNLTDLKSANTLDSLVTENGRTVVKHWLQDVGSTFGMNNDLHEWDLGWEHFYQANTTMKRLLSFGFALSPWQKVRYVEGPSIGKFDGDRFDPRTWRPQTPTTAYMELRDDDAFWAAQRIGAFSGEMIRAIVHTGEFSDPAAEQALGDIMIKRRDTIVRTYLPAVNPIVAPRLDDDKGLSFDNAAVNADVAHAPDSYRAAWFEFDNATGVARPLAHTRSALTTIEAPAGLPRSMGTYVEVEITAEARDYPTWLQPVRAYFRREARGWKLVGLERMADGPQKNQKG